MRKLLILGMLALELAVCGCGNSTNTNTTPPTTAASGKWQAVMVGGHGQSGVLDFVTEFSVDSGGGPLTITALSFLTTQACFVTNETASGSAVLTTSNTNQVTGTLSFTINSGSPAGNQLVLNGTTLTGTSNNGTLSGGLVTGVWTLTGGEGDSTCTGTGTFTLTQSS